LSLLDALILGLIQGIAEFLPISSSTHLELARRLFGLEDHQNFLYFSLVCHAGTMVSLLIYLRRDIFQALKQTRLVSQFAFALAPLIPVYLFSKSLLSFLNQPEYLGYGLLGTALLLGAATRVKQEKIIFSPDISSSRLKWTDVLCIALMQTLSFMPGISRSAATIAAARFRSWPWLDAARFSFLLAIPTILGGECLETYKLLKQEPDFVGSLVWSYYAAGFFSSMIFGLLGAKAMFCIYRKGNLFPFAIYCALLGLLIIGISHA